MHDLISQQNKQQYKFIVIFNKFKCGPKTLILPIAIYEIIFFHLVLV